MPRTPPSEDNRSRKSGRFRPKKASSKTAMGAEAFSQDHSVCLPQELSCSNDANPQENSTQTDAEGRNPQENSAQTDAEGSALAAHDENIAHSREFGASSASQAAEACVTERLKVLSLSQADLQLDEHQLKLNRQDQSDEVLALQAIFEEDFLILKESEDEDEAYMIFINVEVPSVFDVLVELPVQSDSPTMDTDATTDKIRACSLHYLPPLCFVYRPLSHYPSNGPPSFVLSTNWLCENDLSKLCKALDAVWEEQAGNVVVYAWAEWLRANCLSYLGISEELVLHFPEKCKHVEGRVLSGCSAPDKVIPALMRYNEERKHNHFLKSLHTCCICFTEQPGKDFVRLPCTHFFCIECMKQFSRLNVKEGTVKNISCPDTTCKSSIPPTILKQLLDHDEFMRWESLLLQKTLESMMDVVYCPRCETICIEDTDHYVQCTVCLFSFCSLCKGPRHVGQQCMSVEARLRVLEARQQGLQSGEARRRKEQDFANELLNLKYMRDTTKQCPSCKMAISKVEGCNKVTCGNCGQYFCYKCNEAIKGYDHFREGTCILFDDEEVQQWEIAMNINRAPVVPRGGVPLHWRTCPTCGQGNIKEGNNNHILCWSCQQHFCALCRKIVRRSADHYGSGPNKCKQHSTD